MDRAVIKLEQPDCYSMNAKPTDDYNQCLQLVINKLGELEDIEEEVGVDFKWLFNYLKENNSLLYYNSIEKEWMIKKIYETTYFCKGIEVSEDTQ